MLNKQNEIEYNNLFFVLGASTRGVEFVVRPDCGHRRAAKPVRMGDVVVNLSE